MPPMMVAGGPAPFFYPPGAAAPQFLRPITTPGGHPAMSKEPSDQHQLPFAQQPAPAPADGVQFVQPGQFAAGPPGAPQALPPFFFPPPFSGPFGPPPPGGLPLHFSQSMMPPMMYPVPAGQQPPTQLQAGTPLPAATPAGQPISGTRTPQQPQAVGRVTDSVFSDSQK
jgi:hypothetical protein